jgi:hypothetical protein
MLSLKKNRPKIWTRHVASCIGAVEGRCGVEGMAKNGDWISGGIQRRFRKADNRYRGYSYE